MKWRVRWSHVTIALALIAAVAIAPPAIGGPSLKSLVKKEVAKQIGKATGPPGANGINGVNGINGADGTARAYATVRPHETFPCAPGCTFLRSKGITSVTRTDTGRYCVTAPGIDSASTTGAVTVDWAATATPEGNSSALIDSGANCGLGQFSVVTERQSPTDVRNAANNGTTSVAGNAVDSDSVGFTIVIP